jgi:hypothetical protein
MNRKHLESNIQKTKESNIKIKITIELNYKIRFHKQSIYKNEKYFVRLTTQNKPFKFEVKTEIEDLVR